MRVSLPLLPALLAILAAAAPLPAQSLTFGELEGTVTDAQRLPISGAEIRVRDRASGALRRGSTSRDGTFRFAVLPAGRYDLFVETLGFHPLVHLDLAVAVGGPVRLALTLRAGTPPITQVDTVTARRAARDWGTWLFERGYVDLVGGRRTAADAALLSTTSDASAIEGLPWRLTDAMIDGVRSSSGGLATGGGSDAAGLALPVRSTSALSAGSLGFDVEVGASGVGLRATTLRGGVAPVSRWTLEAGSANVGGSLIVGAPLQSDTMQALGGIEYQRVEVERPALLGADAVRNSGIVQAAAPAGVDLAAYAAPAKRVEQRWSGFGRLDWKPSERIGIVLRASGSHLTSTGLHEAEEPLARFGGDYEAVAIQLGSSLHARLSSRLTHELHIGADVSTVQHDDGLVPSTLLSSYGVELGGPVRGGITESRITPRVAALLHLDAGAHRLKAGFSLASHRSDVSRASDGAGSFTFGDTADLAGGVGAWRGLDDVRPAGEFSLVEQAFFLQDSWRLADGLSLTLGARWDDMGLPVDRVEGADSWRTLSGVDNRAVLDPPSRFSPRIGFRWELGARRHWVFEGGAGTFHSLADRRDVAEALTFDRATPVRYGVGAFPAWPDRPSVSDASVVGDQLAILGPDFEGPRTRRIALGLSRATGGWSASIQGIYRHTDQIARRRDLNLPTGPVGLDQYGRPLYGRLQKAGAVVAVEPGTNRRFSGFDAVYAIEATGHSEYVGATLAVERVRERGLSLGSSFTYSRTHDDVGPGLQPSLSPFPDGVDGRDWLAGRSDFNVPSRLLAAAEWRGGADGGFRVGAVYSLQSGGHFTPSVGDGIDANGDGDRSNDPAFIDPALPGMDALIGAHDCLAKRTGTFAERNMCRRASVQRLDLRLAVPVVRTAFGRVDVVVDALDVVATERGPIDRALVNVARSGTLTTDPLTGVTQVPLVVNPNFGRVRADRATGILFRLGVRIVP